MPLSQPHPVALLKVERRLKELIDEGWFPKEYASDYVQKDLKAYRD